MNLKATATFCLGALVGACLALAIFFSAAERGIRKVDATWRATMATDDQIAAVYKDRAETCEKSQAQFYSRYTVLYDASGSTDRTIPLLHGLVSVTVGGVEVKPRWVIPVKIAPIVVGVSDAVAVAYFDPQSKQIEGPYPINVAVWSGDVR